MTPIDKLLPCLEKVRERSPHKWMAACPSHSDRSPSLSIRETEDSRLLLYCFAGCSVDEVVGSVGLTLGDLFPDDPNRDPYYKPNLPRLNGWDAIAVLKHRIVTCCIGVGDVAKGKDLSESDLGTLIDALADIHRVLGECHDIR